MPQSKRWVVYGRSDSGCTDWFINTASEEEAKLFIAQKLKPGQVAMLYEESRLIGMFSLRYDGQGIA